MEEQLKIRGGKLRSEMSYVLISEGGTPTTHKTLTTIGDSRVEMVLSFHGVCSGSSTNPEEEQRDLGNHGSTHEDILLHAHEEHMDLR